MHGILEDYILVYVQNSWVFKCEQFKSIDQSNKAEVFRIKYKFSMVFYLEMGRVTKQECESLELQEWRINVHDIETCRTVSRKLKDRLSLNK
jgi:hypothetical protein